MEAGGRRGREGGRGGDGREVLVSGERVLSANPEGAQKRLSLFKSITEKRHSYYPRLSPHTTALFLRVCACVCGSAQTLS